MLPCPVASARISGGAATSSARNRSVPATDASRRATLRGAQAGSDTKATANERAAIRRTFRRFSG